MNKYENLTPKVDEELQKLINSFPIPRTIHEGHDGLYCPMCDSTAYRKIKFKKEFPFFYIIKVCDSDECSNRFGFK